MTGGLDEFLVNKSNLNNTFINQISQKDYSGRESQKIKAFLLLEHFRLENLLVSK